MKLTGSELRKKLKEANEQNLAAARKAVQDRRDTTDEMMETLRRASQQGRKVRVYYTKLTDGSTVYRVLEPYSFRYGKSSKGPGIWKWFYGHHGKHGRIEKYLVDNIHAIEMTRNYYEPRWPVEIADRIDRSKRKIQPNSPLSHIEMGLAAEPVK